MEMEFVLMITWLRDFFLDCLSRDINRIVNSLVMMQPDSPATCDCEKNRYCAPTEHDKLFHENHVYYNSVIWRTIYTMGLIPQIREVLQKDILESVPKWGGYWGEITSREYATSLLANLVTENPNPRWVDSVMVWDIRTGKPGIEPHFVGNTKTRKEIHE